MKKTADTKGGSSNKAHTHKECESIANLSQVWGHGYVGVMNPFGESEGGASQGRVLKCVGEVWRDGFPGIDDDRAIGQRVRGAFQVGILKRCSKVRRLWLSGVNHHGAIWERIGGFTQSWISQGLSQVWGHGLLNERNQSNKCTHQLNV